MIPTNTPKASETPLTDHSEFTVKAGDIISPVVDWPVVHADFARSLEKRNTALAARVAELERALKDNILNDSRVTAHDELYSNTSSGRPRPAANAGGAHDMSTPNPTAEIRQAVVPLLIQFHMGAFNAGGCADRILAALTPVLDRIVRERDGANEILDAVIVGFDRALSRIIVNDPVGAERELKLAIAQMDNPTITGESCNQLRARCDAVEKERDELTEKITGLRGLDIANEGIVAQLRTRCETAERELAEERKMHAECAEDQIATFKEMSQRGVIIEELRDLLSQVENETDHRNIPGTIRAGLKQIDAARDAKEAT